MGRSNTANGGSTYFDLVIQTVSADADTYVMRAVVYLTSYNVIDSNNNLSVGGNWSRGGTLGLNGAYSNSPVWYQDIAVARQVGANVGISVTASWSSVEYWGTTLSASESAAIPAKIIPPDPPAIDVTAITATSAQVYTTAPGAENGASTTLVNYRIHRVSDGAHMGDLQGGYNPGVVFYNLAAATTYDAYAQSYNAAGWGGFSGAFRFSTLATIPSAPGTPTISAIGPTQATATWTGPGFHGGSAPTSYQLQHSTNAGFTAGLVTATIPGGHATASAVLGSLTPGATYYTRVRSINSVGPGPWSGTRSFTTLTGMRVYTGSSWVNAPVYAWTGSSWVVCEVRIFNGSTWVPTG